MARQTRAGIERAKKLAETAIENKHHYKTAAALTMFCQLIHFVGYGESAIIVAWGYAFFETIFSGDGGPQPPMASA